MCVLESVLPFSIRKGSTRSPLLSVGACLTALNSSLSLVCIYSTLHVALEKAGEDDCNVRVLEHEECDDHGVEKVL